MRGAALTSCHYCYNLRSTEEDGEQDEAAVRTEAAAGAPSEAVLPDAPSSRLAPSSTTAQGNKSFSHTTKLS